MKLLLLLAAPLLLTACGSASVTNAVTRAELRLSAQLMMPLLSAATVQLAARDFSRPLLPVSEAVTSQSLNPQALSCDATNLESNAVDADQDGIPKSASAQLACAYTDEGVDTTSALQLGGSMTVSDNDDQDKQAGLNSSAQLSGTAQTRYKGVSAALKSESSAQASLGPKTGSSYGGSLSFVSESLGSGAAFGIASQVTLRRALNAALQMTPDADQLGGNLQLTGTLQNRNDLSSRVTDLNLSGTLHAHQGACQAADSGSVVFSKGVVSLTATVTGCGVYSYE